MPVQPTISQRFWIKVNRAGPIPAHMPHLGQCWVWTGTIAWTGYGRYRSRKHRQMAHRFAWEDTYGSIPEPLRVLHHCDVRSCVRPTHLFLGTLQDNTRDGISKGRIIPPAFDIRIGSDNGNAKLDERTVQEIKTLHAHGITGRELASMSSVTAATISQIVSGKTWKHVTLS